MSIEITSNLDDYSLFQPNFNFTCSYFGCLGKIKSPLGPDLFFTVSIQLLFGNFLSAQGCEHNIELDREFIFPFQFNSLLGRGGFASVFRGSFHRRDAAFKLIKVRDSDLSLTDDVREFSWKCKGLVIRF